MIEILFYLGGLIFGVSALYLANSIAQDIIESEKRGNKNNG